MSLFRNDNLSKLFRPSNPALLGKLLLLGMTIAVYFQSLGHQFIDKYDDYLYVTQNPAVRGFTLEHLQAACTNYYVGNYAPLQIISYMLDYSLWGLNPAGFIGTNIVLHALNGMLYYDMLDRLTAKTRVAFWATFIFLFHPVQVESVVWISQRKTLLAMFFMLISLRCYITLRGKKGSDWYLSYGVALFTFILALLSKSVAVVLPPILILYDLCYCAKDKRPRWIINKLPFVAAAAIVALIALRSQQPEVGGGITGYHGGSPLATFLTMLTVLVRYAGMLLWPSNLSLIYTPAIRTGVDGAVLGAGLLVLFACLGLGCLWRKNRRLFFWAALVPIGLLPVSQIVPLVTLMNDRYLYFPLLGFAALFAWAACYCLDRLPLAAKPAGTLGLCLVLLPLPVLTWQRAEVWRDSFALVSDTARKYPTADVWVVFGDLMYSAGRYAESAEMNENALLLAPGYRNALNNLGETYLILGRYDQSVKHLETLVSENPEYAKGYRLLGIACLLTGNVQEGSRALNLALQLEPDNGARINKYGHIYEKLGNLEVALVCYQQAVISGVATAGYSYDLARLQAMSGRPGEAVRNLRNARRLGLPDAGRMLQDPAFDSLRPLPEFRDLIK